MHEEDSAGVRAHGAPRRPPFRREMEPLPAWETLCACSKRRTLTFAVLADMGLVSLTETQLTLPARATASAGSSSPRDPSSRRRCTA